MSVDLASLFIKVDATQPAMAAKTLDSLTASGTRTEAAMGRVSLSANRLSAEARLAASGMGALGAAIGAVALLAFVREATALADTYKNMQGRLGLVTKSTFELAQVTQELFDVAQRTRGSLEGTVDLYARLARSTKSLGAGQADLIAVTETINRSLVISGASAGAASAALMQLGQAFASGTLRGDELNSVMEQAPRLTQAIADGMGVTIGQLRALGAEGKITSKAVFEALKGQGDAIAAEFGKMPLTVGQAWTMIMNGALKYVGEADKARGVTAALSAAMVILADNIDVIGNTLLTVAAAGAALAAVIGVRMVAAFVAQTIATIAATNAMRAYALSVALVGPVAATAAVATSALTGAVGLLARGLAFFGGPIGVAIIAVGTALAFVGAEAMKSSKLVDEAGASAKQTTQMLQSMGLAAGGAADKSKAVGAASIGAALGVQAFGGKAGVAAQQLYGLAAAAKAAAYESLVAQRAMLGGKLADVSLRTQEGRREDATKDYGRDIFGAAGSAVRLVAGEGRAMLDGGKRDRELAASKNDLTAAIAKVDAGLKEVAGTATEKYIPATVAAGAETDKAAKKVKAKKDAHDELAEAMKRATQDADDYLAVLRRETEEFGKSATAIKELEIARAAAEAPEPSQKAAITDAGDQLIGLMKGADAIREINSGLVTMAEVVGDIDFSKLALDDLIVELQMVDDLALDAAAGMEGAFGKMGRAIGGITASVTGLRVQLAALYKAEPDPEKRIQAEASLRVRAYGDMTSAAKDFFEEGSAGYKLLEGAERAFRIVEFGLALASITMKGVEAAATVGSEAVQTSAVLAGTAVRTPAKAAEGIAGIFAALGPFGFPVAAAAIAVMAAAGVAALGGGGGGSVPGATDMKDRQKAQGAGSVLGDAAAQSESLTRALEIVAQNTNTDLEYSNAMLKALRSIDSQIGAVATALARTLGAGGTLDTEKLNLGASGRPATLGNLGFGSTKTRELQDQGLQFDAQSLSQILAGGIQGASFQQVLETSVKKAFGITYSNKTTSTTTTGELDADLARQITGLIGSLKSGVLEAAKVLGVEGAEATLDAFQVSLGKLSFKDMSGAEITEALNGIFGKLGDDLAATAIPALVELQKVGEGAFETLARVARGYQVIDVSLRSIGMEFGAVGVASLAARERLVDLVGGIDALTEQTSFFAETFLSDAERMAPIQKSVTDELKRLGLSGLTTKDQFKSLVLGLDLSTAAGAELYAAMLSLAPAFAKVVDFAAEGSQAVQDAKSDLRDAWQAEREDIVETIDKLNAFSDSLAKFRDQLYSGPAAMLSPEEKYRSSKSAFELTSAKAQGGDEKAIGELQGVSQAFLDASKDYYASSQPYFADLEAVRTSVAATQSLTAGMASSAEQQLAALDAEVGLLIDIKGGVLSVRDAILALRAAEEAAKAASKPFDGSDYLDANADLAAAFQRYLAGDAAYADPNAGYKPGMSADEFGQTHYDRGGKNENRKTFAAAPTPPAPAITVVNDNSALAAELAALRGEMQALVRQNGAGATATVAALDRVSETNESVVRAVRDREIA